MSSIITPKIAKGQPHSSGGISLPIISHVAPGNPPDAADNPNTVITVPAIIQPIQTSNLMRVFLPPLAFFSPQVEYPFLL